MKMRGSIEWIKWISLPRQAVGRARTKIFEKDITGQTNILLTIILISAVCFSVVGGGLNPTPWSVYITGNFDGSIILDCASTTNNGSIQWYFKRFNQDVYAVLYRYKMIEGDFGTTYEVKTNSTALVIKTVSKSEAGEYKCFDNHGNGDWACAEVVVFENPTCQDKLIGDQAEICCSVGYWGHVAPRMTFHNPLQELTSDVANKSEINTAHFCVTVYLTENAVVYTCKAILPIGVGCQTKWRSPEYSFPWSKALSKASLDTGSGNGTGWKVAVGCVGGGAVVILFIVAWWKRDSFCFCCITKNISESVPMNPASDVERENSGSNAEQEVSNNTNAASDVKRKKNGRNTEKMPMTTPA